MGKQPFLAATHLPVIVIKKSNPMPSALKYRECFCLWRNLGDNLHCRSACANDPNAGINQVLVMIPAGRMELITGEIFHASDVRNKRTIQLTHSAD